MEPVPHNVLQHIGSFVPLSHAAYVNDVLQVDRHDPYFIDAMAELGIDPVVLIATERLRRRNDALLRSSPIYKLVQFLYEKGPWSLSSNGHDIVDIAWENAYICIDDADLNEIRNFIDGYVSDIYYTTRYDEDPPRIRYLPTIGETGVRIEALRSQCLDVLATAIIDTDRLVTNEIRSAGRALDDPVIVTTPTRRFRQYTSLGASSR
jgi:hypothetical protein